MLMTGVDVYATDVSKIWFSAEYLHGISDCHEHELDETVVNLHLVNDNLRASMAKPEGFLSTMPNDNSTEGQSEAKDARGEDRNLGHGDVLRRNGIRVSLTCRLVTKVHKNLFKF
jgi:hypothetical protein